MKKNLFHNPPKIIAHRGASKYAPENTLIAMQKAAELGAQWVEFDVMLTKDDEAIIIHDETLERTTNGKGKVADHSLNQVKQLDAGKWFDKKFTGQCVPTLSELLDYLQQHNLQMNLEIKPSLNRDVETTEKIIKILRQQWPLQEFPPLLSSASEIALATAYAVAPDLLLGWIVDEWRQDWQQKMEALHCISLHINYAVLDEAKVQLIKQAGYLIFSYTVNDSARAKQLFAWGVDGIFTDDPRILISENEILNV